jgi:hypothetical protein
VRGASIFASVCLALTAPVAAQDAATGYQSSWVEAYDSLQGFANAGLTQGEAAGRDELLAAYRREAGRHAAAIAALGGMLPPAEAVAAHWRMLPLHERAQSAMTLVIRAIELEDAAAVSAAWRSLDDAVKALQRTRQELE